MTHTIANFRTGIGNFVLFTPALRAMASMDPSGTVDLCIDMNWTDPRRAAVVELASKLPFINHVLGWPNDVKPIAANYKVWFWSPWTSTGEAREYFSQRKPYDCGDWNQRRTHEYDYYLNIARRFYGFDGLSPKQSIVCANVPMVEKSEKKLVVLCNGSFGHIGAFKKWHSFNDLATMIKGLYGDEVIIAKIGYRDELSDVKTFDLDFVGTLSITETANVIAQADLMVTTDTGNMHIADALGTPLMVLWGGSVVEKNKPVNSWNQIIHLGYSCQPCINSGAYRECNSMKCIDDITVGEVMFNIRQFFKERGIYGRTELG